MYMKVFLCLVPKRLLPIKISAICNLEDWTKLNTNTFKKFLKTQIQKIIKKQFDINLLCECYKKFNYFNPSVPNCPHMTPVVTDCNHHQYVSPEYYRDAPLESAPLTPGLRSAEVTGQNQRHTPEQLYYSDNLNCGYQGRISDCNRVLASDFITCLTTFFKY